MLGIKIMCCLGFNSSIKWEKDCDEKPRLFCIDILHPGIYKINLSIRVRLSRHSAASLLYAKLRAGNLHEFNKSPRLISIAKRYLLFSIAPSCTNSFHHWYHFWIHDAEELAKITKWHLGDRYRLCSYSSSNWFNIDRITKFSGTRRENIALSFKAGKIICYYCASEWQTRQFTYDSNAK